MAYFAALSRFKTDVSGLSVPSSRVKLSKPETGSGGGIWGNGVWCCGPCNTGGRRARKGVWLSWFEFLDETLSSLPIHVYYAWSLAFAADKLNYSALWVITRREVVRNRRCETTFGIPIVGSTETSILNHLTPRNNPEDGRIWLFLCFPQHHLC